MKSAGPAREKGMSKKKMAAAKKKIISTKPAAHNKSVATELSASANSDPKQEQPLNKEPTDMNPAEEPKADKV